MICGKKHWSNSDKASGKGRLFAPCLPLPFESECVYISKLCKVKGAINKISSGLSLKCLEGANVQLRWSTSANQSGTSQICWLMFLSKQPIRDSWERKSKSNQIHPNEASFMTSRLLPSNYVMWQKYALKRREGKELFYGNFTFFGREISIFFYIKQFRKVSRKPLEWVLKFG